MAGIIDAFQEYQIAAAIKRNTVTNVNGVKTNDWAAVETIECLFWEGSIAEAYVSQRFRDITDAALGVSPETDIEKNDIVTVDGVEYHVNGIDNIGKFGEYILVSLAVRA